MSEFTTIILSVFAFKNNFSVVYSFAGSSAHHYIREFETASNIPWEPAAGRDAANEGAKATKATE